MFDFSISLLGCKAVIQSHFRPWITTSLQMSLSMFLHPFISLLLFSSVHTCLQNKVQHIFIAQCIWAACESVMSTIASSISCFHASPSGHKSTDSFPQICSISLSSHRVVSEMKLCSENVKNTTLLHPSQQTVRSHRP